MPEQNPWEAFNQQQQAQQVAMAQMVQQNENFKGNIPASIVGTTTVTLPRVDVIIPAYNCHKTIAKTIASIVVQKISNDIDVTIVNDASTDGDYSDFVTRFSPYINIREIKMEKNGGPGLARQYGIDHTSNPLITFIDADDTFSGAFSIGQLRKNLITDPKCHMVVGGFVEEQGDNFISHGGDMIWMFGKMYSRKFLDKYNIRFNESRANEDTGFNTLVKLLSNENEQIKIIGDIVYYWHCRNDSITRRHNCEYSFNQSFIGFTDNMIDAIKRAKEINPFNGNINPFIVETMCNLYAYYIESFVRDPRFNEQNLNNCYKFYCEVYSSIEKDVTEKVLASFYNNVMRNSYAGNKFADIIPHIGIKEFLVEMKAKMERGDEIKKFADITDNIVNKDLVQNYKNYSGENGKQNIVEN